MPLNNSAPLDRKTLDQQLNLRARWPEHPTHFARWAKDSAEVRKDPRAQLDLSYGPGLSQTLNFYRPATKTLVPLLFFIHGGYWQSLDKSDFDYLAPPFLDQAVAYASINYPLAPKARMADIVASVGLAFDWLAARSEALGLDPNRLCVAGHSAGGHLAACLALGLTNKTRPCAGVSVSGVYDLSPIARSYHNDVLHLQDSEVGDFSPARLESLGNSAPMVLAVGGEETEIFLLQQRDFYQNLQRQGAAVAEIPLPGRNHFTAIDALAEPDHPLFVQALELAQNGTFP